MQRVSSAGVGLRAILRQKMLQKICGSPSTKLFSKIFQIRKKLFSGADGNAVWSAFEGLAQLGPDVARRDVSGKCLRWRGGAGGIRRGGGGGREVTPVHSRLLSPVVLVGVFVTGAFLLLLVLLFDDALEQPLEGVYFLVFVIQNVF